MTAGSHGSTYGGNPLAMAAGNAVLDVVLKPGFMENVQARGDELKAGLEKLVAKYPTLLESARGRGLMVGLKCSAKILNGDLVAKAMAHGLLSVPAGDNVVRFVPPMVITSEQINEAVSILDTALSELSSDSTD